MPWPPSFQRPTYAGFWIRVVSWIIDGIVLAIISAAIPPLLGAGPGVTFDGARVDIDYGANALGALVGLIYFVGLWSWKGQTLGMMPFGIWVVRAEDGGRVDPLRALVRYVGLIISFAVLLLGVIWVAFDDRKQGWHDKLANTFVVRYLPRLEAAAR
jgi:uncharacterized RDD family membrane protein YckC